MAISQSDFDAWFAANPNATPNDAAQAVKSIGGLEANPGLSGLLAEKFQSTPENVVNYYNSYTAPISNKPSVAVDRFPFQPITSPSDPLKTDLNAYPINTSAISSSEPKPDLPVKGVALATAASPNITAGQAAVDKFFAENPNATASQAAQAVASIGGLSALTGLTEALAQKYSNTPQQITDAYTNYITQKTPPPTFNDVYQPWLSSYQQQFGTDINRPWNADQDSANVKAALDKQYIDKIDQYNKQYGTNLKPDASVLGVDAQPNSFTVQPTGGGPGFGGWLSDTVHHIGTTIARSPILNTAAVAAMTYFGVPPSVASGIVSANAGASPEVIARNMILAGISAEVAQKVAPQVSQLTGGGNFGATAGQVAGQAAGSATTAVLTGRDPIQAALNATIAGGITAGTSEILKDVEGFQDLTRDQQKAVVTAVSAKLQGKDPTAALINQALDIGRQTVRDTLNTKIEEADFDVNQGAVNKVADFQARDIEAEDAARAAEARRLADEENVRQIEAARAEQGGTSTEPPSGLQLAAGPTSTVSDAGGGYRVEMGGAPIYAESPNADKVKVPFGYDLMPSQLNEKGKLPKGAYYDTLLNAWLMPNNDVTDLQAQLTGLDIPIDSQVNNNFDFGVNNGAVDRVAMNEPSSTYNPPNYASQDSGVTQDSIDSSQATQQANAAAGKWPAGYTGNGDGTATVVRDDGSTITIDDKNNIIYVTDATDGSPISDNNTVPNTVKTQPTITKTPTTTATTDVLFKSMPTAQKSVVMNMVANGTPLAEAVTSASAFTPVGIKTSPDDGGSKFEGPLDAFLKMVKESDYSKKPVEQTNQQGPAVQQDFLSQPSNYFSYGQPTEIDQLISGQVPNFTAKAGGLAVPMMAAGGNTRYGKYAGGGLNVVNHSGKDRLDFRKGDAVTGPGDGQSDDIPAMLADGEFVFPADVVAALGNGSTKAGSDKLYDMMHSIREYHRAAKPKDLPPPAKKSPLDYLKSSKARR